MKEMVKRAVPYLLDCMHYGFENKVWNLAMDGELSDLKGLVSRSDIVGDGYKGLLEALDMHGVEQDLLGSLEEPIIKQLMTSRNRMQYFKDKFSRMHGYNTWMDIDEEAEKLAWKIYNNYHDRGTEETDGRLAKARAIYRNKEQMVMDCMDVLILAEMAHKSTKEDDDCIMFLVEVVKGLHEDEDGIGKDKDGDAHSGTW